MFCYRFLGPTELRCMCLSFRVYQVYPESNVQRVVWAQVCFFSAEPHFISRCHVCPNCIDLSGPCLLISPAVDRARHCFDTIHCAMIHFLVHFLHVFVGVNHLLIIPHLLGIWKGEQSLCVQVLVRACEPHLGTHQSIVSRVSNFRDVTDLLREGFHHFCALFCLCSCFILINYCVRSFHTLSMTGALVVCRLWD